MNECSNPITNDCTDICINTLGSFNCSCPNGYLGDGRKGGKGCIDPKSKFPVIEVASGIYSLSLKQHVCWCWIYHYLFLLFLCSIKPVTCSWWIITYICRSRGWILGASNCSELAIFQPKETKDHQTQGEVLRAKWRSVTKTANFIKWRHHGINQNIYGWTAQASY